MSCSCHGYKTPFSIHNWCSYDWLSLYQDSSQSMRPGKCAIPLCIFPHIKEINNIFIFIRDMKKMFIFSTSLAKIYSLMLKKLWGPKYTRSSYFVFSYIGSIHRLTWNSFFFNLACTTLYYTVHLTLCFVRDFEKVKICRYYSTLMRNTLLISSIQVNAKVLVQTLSSNR